MNLRKGISPILATVIIIAVTLVIAIGVIGWIMGIWGTFGSTESLQIMPDSTLSADGTLSLHIKNTGTASAVINKVEIVGTGLSTSTTATVGPGTDTTITISFNAASGKIVAGASYQVKVYTAAGNVYSTVITASSSS